LRMANCQKTVRTEHYHQYGFEKITPNEICDYTRLKILSMWL
jgi:hypothetical protein